MTSQLLLYNRALRFVGERQIASLSEDAPARHYLDEAYEDGFVNEVLEAGMWNFAIRTRQFDADDSIEPSFGLQFAFAKPSDWIKSVAVCSDERFNCPLIPFNDEAGYWYADTDPIYVRYVSNDALFGGNLDAWPQSFAKFAACLLALEINPRLTDSKTGQEELKKDCARILASAKAKDAINEAVTFIPEGLWNASRRDHSGGSRYQSRWNGGWR